MVGTLSEFDGLPQGGLFVRHLNVPVEPYRSFADGSFGNDGHDVPAIGMGIDCGSFENEPRIVHECSECGTFYCILKIPWNFVRCNFAIQNHGTLRD
jgi:hypothetical protein